MADLDLRALERTPLENPERYVTAARRLGSAKHYEALVAVGWVTEGQAKVLAYCGDVGVRATLGWTGRNGRVYYRNSAGVETNKIDALKVLELPGYLVTYTAFTHGLIPFVHNLPNPPERLWDCAQCQWRGYWHPECRDCKGAADRRGRRPPKPNQRQRWYMALVARNVAQAVLPLWQGCEGEGNMEADTPEANGCVACKAPRRAIEAISHWLDDPSKLRQRRCDDLTGHALPEWCEQALLCVVGRHEQLPDHLAACMDDVNDDEMDTAAQYGIRGAPVALEALRPYCGRWSV